MTCRCIINNTEINISEAGFIGVICSFIDTFDPNYNLGSDDLPFDIELLNITSPKLFHLFRLDERNWRLKNKYNDVKRFHNSLFKNNPMRPLSPVYFGTTSKTYFMPENFIIEFLLGYVIVQSL